MAEKVDSAQRICRGDKQIKLSYIRPELTSSYLLCYNLKLGLGLHSKKKMLNAPSNWFPWLRLPHVPNRARAGVWVSHRLPSQNTTVYIKAKLLLEEMQKGGSAAQLVENTGRMGVRVSRMEVKRLMDVTMSISLLIKMLAFPLCVK